MQSLSNLNDKYGLKLGVQEIREMSTNELKNKIRSIKRERGDKIYQVSKFGIKGMKPFHNQ